ncbi:hypothetical protein GO988_08040 [Hymenobacter sp. HMF4947]|uniref:Toxin-antitoxin system YwqK family antitoxin n=1 Tax=Hymenobacter ginkgonis TaxID=2682976 RepID=A0A7K1TD68_9BACT|nr:hypothetical protein [Hymenobacter ginkgonis]MVN76272.1 hypothetical protein [Hymenobacter ginkgonis]
MRVLLFVLLGLVATACVTSQPRVANSPRGFWHTNRLDRRGDPIGRWNVYYDSAHARPFTQGRYRHGRAVGRWRYYSPVGGLVRQERYRRHGLNDITYYHPNGHIARQGHARVVDEPDGLHFYWFGEWLNYSETGALQKVETYQNGRLIGTRRVQDI